MPCIKRLLSGEKYEEKSQWWFSSKHILQWSVELKMELMLPWMSFFPHPTLTLLIRFNVLYLISVYWLMYYFFYNILGFATFFVTKSHYIAKSSFLSAQKLGLWCFQVWPHFCQSSFICRGIYKNVEKNLISWSIKASAGCVTMVTDSSFLEINEILGHSTLQEHWFL